MATHVDPRRTRRVDPTYRRRRHRAFRATIAGLSVVALLVGGAPTGTASPHDDGGWRKERTIQAHTRLEYRGPVFQLPNGGTVALWTNARDEHLFSAQRQPGGDWSAPEDISGPYSRVWILRAVEDPGNEITVAWRGTMKGQPSIWSRRMVDGEWTEPHLEAVVKNNSVELGLATARGVTAVQWSEYNPETDESIVKIAVRHRGGEVTILPPLPTPNQYVAHLALDSAGLPTVVGSPEGRMLVSTYGSDGAWAEEQIGPSPGYEIPDDFYWTERITATSNRAGALAVAWLELPDGGDPDDPGTTVVRFRSPGGSFTSPHTFTTESTCEGPSGCVSLGMAADGDVTALYPTWLGGLRADVWFTLRDAASQTWDPPHRLVDDVNRYETGVQSTAPGGGSVIAIATESGHLVYRCGPAGHCGSPVLLNPPARYKDVYVDSARGGAALLWGQGCAFECEYDTRLLARVYE